MGLTRKMSTLEFTGEDSKTLIKASSKYLEFSGSSPKEQFISTKNSVSLCEIMERIISAKCLSLFTVLMKGQSQSFSYINEAGSLTVLLGITCINTQRTQKGRECDSSVFLLLLI